MAGSILAAAADSGRGTLGGFRTGGGAVAAPALFKPNFYAQLQAPLRLFHPEWVDER